MRKVLVMDNKAFVVDEDEERWVTMNGKHVLIVNGEPQFSVSKPQKSFKTKRYEHKTYKPYTEKEKDANWKKYQDEDKRLRKEQREQNKSVNEKLKSLNEIDKKMRDFDREWTKEFYKIKRRKNKPETWEQDMMKKRSDYAKKIGWTSELRKEREDLMAEKKHRADIRENDRFNAYKVYEWTSRADEEKGKRFDKLKPVIEKVKQKVNTGRDALKKANTPEKANAAVKEKQDKKGGG